MLAFLPAPLLAVIITLLYCLLTFLLPIPILVIGLFQWLIPVKKWQVMCDGWMQTIGMCWGDLSNAILMLTTQIDWQINNVADLSPSKSYLIIANHQSWADIIILQKIFNRKIPLNRYFIKKQLVQVPIIGWCCKLLHFPAMQRLSREKLAQYPHLKGKDIETTRRACEKFRAIRVSIVNFAEGTRFTAAKQQAQQSPYQHLLIPRAGGIAFVLAAMGEYLDAVLNVTIIYDKPNPSLWDFFTGKVKRVVVDVQKQAVTQALLGDYLNDPEFKKKFQYWLNQLWVQKDRRISELQSR